MKLGEILSNSGNEMIKNAYYWKGDDFELTIVKRKGFIAMMIEKGDDHQTAIFTRKEFFSFICEIVKYVLLLPIVARRIPFYESCSTSREKSHGTLKPVKLRVDEGGNVLMSLYTPWAQYHGIEEGDEIIWWEEDGMLLSSPLKTKAKIIKDVSPRWEGKKTFITRVKTNKNS